MSHPDPMFDPDNCYHDDSMAYHNEEPMNEDADVDETEYETYDDFGYDDDNYDDYNDFTDEVGGDPEYYLNEDENDSYDDSMDGDAESAFGSCGWGVDEYYNTDCDYGEDY